MNPEAVRWIKFWRDELDADYDELRPVYEYDSHAAYRTALAAANSPEWAVYWDNQLKNVCLSEIVANMKEHIGIFRIAHSTREALHAFIDDEDVRANAMEYAAWERDATPYAAEELHDELAVAS